MAEAPDNGGEGGGGGAEQEHAGEGSLNGAVDDKGDGNGGDGVLNGEGAKDNAQEVDYAKMTDDEYLGKVTLPEGQKWDKTAMGRYAPLLRESKIPPEVFSKFVELDAKIAKELDDAAKKKEAEDNKAAQDAFKAAGDEFRREYTPEQMKDMNDTLSKIDDETFRALVTKSPLANNKTMGKMLLAYRKVYGGDDTLPGSGKAVGGGTDFAKLWMGGK